MHWLPDTLSGRLILVLLASLGLFHVGSIYFYEIGMGTATLAAHDEQLAERLVSIRRSVSDKPPAQREDMAHGLSTATLSIHWSDHSLAIAAAANQPDLLAFRKKLLAALPGALTESQTRLGYADMMGMGEHHQHSMRPLQVSLQLEDASWINFDIAGAPAASAHDHGTIVSTTIMALGIVLVSLLVVRLFSSPLQRLAAAATRLGQNIHAPPLPETGPRELRQAAKAFNTMQAELQRMMAERSLALAAISHDLRTPLTRIRLRAEFIQDEELRERTERDVLEMQGLIDSALSYLRDESDLSAPDTLDLAALLDELADGFQETGAIILTHLPERAPYLGRRQGLHRAFSNLIGNAIKYGKQAEITLEAISSGYRLTIEDQGPGIPPDEQAKVLEPFYRIDKSRSDGIGGSGLGLSVANSVISKHGGTLELSNRPEGGLKVVITL